MYSNDILVWMTKLVEIEIFYTLSIDVFGLWRKCDRVWMRIIYFSHTHIQ